MRQHVKCYVLLPLGLLGHPQSDWVTRKSPNSGAGLQQNIGHRRVRQELTINHFTKVLQNTISLPLKPTKMKTRHVCLTVYDITIAARQNLCV